MGAFKQFNSQDIIVSPFEVNKGFYYKGNALTGSDVGIDRYLGSNGDYIISGSELTGQISGQELPKVLVYNSVQQLYYSNYISGSGGFSGNAATSSILLGANREGDTFTGANQSTNYYNYPQTTLWPSRYFPTSSNSEPIVTAGIISIPSKLFGDYIQPKSFYLEGTSGSIKDDGEGRLLWKHNNSPATDYEYMNGNIIYEHGIVTLFDSETIIRPSAIYGTDKYGEAATYGQAEYDLSVYPGTVTVRKDLINPFITSSNVTMSFSSSYKIFETQYKATLLENEFNYTLNPSAISGSEIPKTFSGSNLNFENTASYGKPYDFATSSYFDPYITTVGLYNNSFELLAVGKLAKPTPTSPTTDTTILINIDR